MKKVKINTGVEEEIVNADADWNDTIDTQIAKGLGLTLEQYREFRELETNEEMDSFMKEHQKK